MRYKSEGEVHKDFHGLTCSTLHYLLDNYGEEAIKEVLTNTAQKVYKTMHEAVKLGDFSELLEYWRYYLDREGGEYAVEELPDGVRITVNNCPALRHLVKLERAPDHIICEATKIFNSALCEGSNVASSLVSTGEFSCVQEFRRSKQ